MKKHLAPTLWIVLISMLLIQTLITGCSAGRKRMIPSEKIVSRELSDLTDFNALNVSHAISVKVTQGADYAVTLHCPDNLEEYVETRMQGKTLYVTLSEDIAIWHKTNVELSITMPQVVDVVLSGASDAEFRGQFEADQFSAVLNGASDLEGLQLTTNRAGISMYGASSYKGVLTANRASILAEGASECSLLSRDINTMELGVGSASEVDMKGRIATLRASLSAASELDGVDLAVEDLDIRMSGASEAKLGNHGTLRYNLSGASDLVVYGTPRILSSESGSGSSFKQR